MSPLEQALREAFVSDLDTHTDGLVDDVRRGADRRRRRRTTAVAAGAVAAVFAIVGIGAAIVLGSDDDALEPTPDPTPTITDTVPAPAPAPGRQSWEVEVAGDEVFVTAHAADCRCGVLWHGRSGRWTRLHDFPFDYVERLAFAADGQHGLATGPGTDLWATADSGRSWVRAAVPDDGDADGRSFVVAVTDRHAWALDLIGGVLWRADLGTDAWEAVGGPGVGPVSDLFTAGDRLVVANRPIVEGSTESFPAYSYDSGTSWGDLSWPCGGENQMLPTDGAIFVVCPDGRDAAIVYRSTEDGEWHEFGRTSGTLASVIPIRQDRVLIEGRHDVLLTEKGEYPVDLGLTRDASIWDSAQAGGSTYLTTTDGVLVSTDDGLTWGPAE